MLSADFNRCGYIENHGFIVFANVLVDKFLDGLKFFFLHIAVQKQSSVVFVVICHWGYLCFCPVIWRVLAAFNEFL